MKKVLPFDCDLTDEYQAIAISCHLKDYKLCWNLNNILHTNFRKKPDLEFASKKSNIEKYSFYYFFNHDLRCTYYLISNKKNNSLILEKMQGIDFILLIKGYFLGDEIKHILQNLRSTPNILTAFTIDMTRLNKEMNLFLSELEIHYLTVLRDSKTNLLIQQ